MYSGCTAIDNDDVVNLLANVHFHKMEDVKQFCFEFLESALTVDNCIDVYQLSTFYESTSDINETYLIISKNFDQNHTIRKLENAFQ